MVPSLLPMPVMEALKWLVPIATAGLIIAGCWAPRRASARLQRVVVAGLAVVALFALVDYTANHVRWRKYFNDYELYHYYIGTKYADEVGYANMYAASVLAQQELGHKPLPRKVRDLASGRHVPVSKILAQRDEVRGRFSPERWRELKQDIAFFRDRVTRRQWHQQLTDKGYNASPVWTMVGGSLANLFPTTPFASVQMLALLDVLLLLVSLGCVRWAFGTRTALLVLLVLTTHYVTSHTHQKAAFLRTDWISALVMSLAFLKKGYFKTAGALTAYAALVRVFPAVFAFGIGAKLLHTFVHERRLNRDYLAYAISGCVTAAVLVVASIGYTGTDYWREFIDKITHHNDAITAWRVGFKYIFLLSWDGRGPLGSNPLHFFQSWSPLWWAMQLAVLAVSYRLVTRLEDHDAQAWGFVLVFFLVAPTYYYYIVLLVPAVYLASRLSDPLRAGALAYLFLTSIAANAGHAVWGRSFPLFFLVSALMLVLVLWIGLIAWRDGRR